jgi:threonine/homoserine/homoserine lactone efflux protein
LALIPTATLGVFFAVAVALAIAPGPDNLFVLAQSALHGRCAGLAVTIGLCTGLLVHTAAVVLGVAALVQSSDLAFTILKSLGAAYLVYLAWTMLRAAPSGGSAPAAGAMSKRALYARGIVMNVSNPKVMVFMLAFLPQFADASRGSLPAQVLVLGATMILATLLVFGAIAWTAGFLGEWLKRSPRAQRIMNRIAAALFVGLALRLAVSTA